jgi:Protein of unknown function (DUF3106)
MKLGFQFGAWVCGLGLGAALLLPWAGAQNRPSQDRAPARQQAPSRPANQGSRSDRAPGGYHPQGSRAAGQGSRQPAPQPRDSRAAQNRVPRNANRAIENRAQGNPNDNRAVGRNERPQSSYRQQTPAAPPPNVQERLRNMSPQEKSRLAENQRRFNQLPAQKQQEMRQAAQQWNRLTPEQRTHIQNDVLPKWKELPSNRQRAIEQRLGVLRNMPESARNRHLDDPNFTRGMTEDDRQMLRDLSHEHVGAPDRPQQ